MDDADLLALEPDPKPEALPAVPVQEDSSAPTEGTAPSETLYAPRLRGARFLCLPLAIAHVEARAWGAG